LAAPKDAAAAVQRQTQSFSKLLITQYFIKLYGKRTFRRLNQPFFAFFSNLLSWSANK
jgi:hypothetical protein